MPLFDTRRVVACLAFACAALACLPHDAQGAPSVPATSNRQTVTPLPASIQAAVASEFIRDNPGWVASPPRARFSPTLDGAMRPALGPPREITTTEAAALARAFVSKNARHFGLTPAEITVLEQRAPSRLHARPDDPRDQWTVRFAGTLPRPGYEGLQLDRRIDLSVTLCVDGAPCYIVQASDPAALSFRTTPRLAANAPAVLANVIGKPKFLYADAGPESDYTRFWRRIPNGAVTKSDVRTIERMVHVTNKGNSVTYVLAYEILVTNGPDNIIGWIVDSDTGEILDAPRPPGTVVP